ncbi:hypothetical protein K7X08_024044 [Anisodus acutangulus]|uniref:Uncharacterized protein n=1 Tax=Anisodus acutangulus TaxID=402998 RepID=A0A9Q1M7M3_9SOLA|nr:hypothetical protein K7X08_024044 [Anisodus acutangulus]
MRKQKILLALQAIKHLMRLDADDPKSHMCLIKFFHKVDSLPTPVTDTEKLIWGVLEAERPAFSQLHGKSLIEANNTFLEKHRECLMHRAVVAELLYVLEPNKKAEAVKLIEDSVNDLVSADGAQGKTRSWKLNDCITVHKLLETTLDDHDAATRLKVRCAEYFPCSTYFGGIKSSAYNQSAGEAKWNYIEFLEYTLTTIDGSRGNFQGSDQIPGRVCGLAQNIFNNFQI